MSQTSPRMTLGVSDGVGPSPMRTFSGRNSIQQVWPGLAEMSCSMVKLPACSLSTVMRPPETLSTTPSMRLMSPMKSAT